MLGEDDIVSCFDLMHSLDQAKAAAARDTLQKADRASLDGALRQLVKSPSPRLRCEAAEWLARISGADSTDALVSLLGDPDHVVRWAAAGLLYDVGDVSAADELLRVARSDSEVVVRIAAIWAVGRTADSRAIEPLAEIARHNRSADEEGRRVDTAALAAIAELESRRV